MPIILNPIHQLETTIAGGDHWLIKSHVETIIKQYGPKATFNTDFKY